MTKPVLEVHGLCLSFGAIQVADNITFDLHPGDRTAVIGPNGAGKTTLINMLTGVLTPDKGALTLNGRNLLALKPHERARAGLGRTYQITNLFPGLTVFENLFLPVAERLGVSTGTWSPAYARVGITQQVERILELVALSNHAGKRVASLPYGVRRLVELGIALALDPKVLLLDEPAAGIPNQEAALIQRVVDELPRDIAVLLVEHDMELVFRFARRIIVLVEGAVLRSGTPEEIARDPKVRQIYLGEAA